MMKPLFKYRKSVFSQHGEDGIIEEILNRLKISSSSECWAVDVGAWDGKHLSNCFSLIQQGWRGVFIEGDQAKFNDLLETVKQHPQIVPIHAYVDQYNTQPNSLDNLFSKTNLPNDFELLSIDIDSYDSDVWETLENYSAKIVVIETNSNPGPKEKWRHITPPAGEISRGTTYASMLEVGDKKGYTLVAYTGNCIFVRNDLKDLIGNTVSTEDMFYTINQY